LLSAVSTTYNGFYFISLEPWDQRNEKGLTADVIIRELNRRLAGVRAAQAFAFAPPAVPGIGTAGGVTFTLEDRAGKDPAFQAEGDFRTRAENVGQFYVRNARGESVPHSTLVSIKPVSGPEFTTRFNEYRAAQINGLLAPGFTTRQGMRALEEVFAQTMSRDMGFDYSG